MLITFIMGTRMTKNISGQYEDVNNPARTLMIN